MKRLVIRGLSIAAIALILPSCGLPAAAARTVGNTVNTATSAMSGAWDVATAANR